MVYVEFIRVNDTKARVVYQHYFPDELQDKSKGLLVEGIPEPEYRKSQSSVLYVNPQTSELWYEYEPAPDTKGNIQLQIDELTLMLGDALLGGAA